MFDSNIDQIVVANSVGNDKVDWYRHEFFKKIFNHLVSANVLSKGTVVRFLDKDVLSKDISAINLIIRASLEAFLLFHYIYINPTSREVVQFRFHGWWREGLLTQLGYDVVGIEAASIREHNQKEVTEILELLKSSSEFNALTKEQKKSLIEKGKWKWIGWRDMLMNTKFSSTYRNNIYSFLSSYAHSESVGMVQVRLMGHENKTDKFIEISMNMMIVVCSVFLQYYWESASLADRRMPQADTDFIETWSILGTHEPKKNG